jgi:2'-5' RNA ligase
MLVFIGIVPPSPFYDSIAAIQKQHGDNRTEPHITLRPPVHLKDDEMWLQAVEEVIGSTGVFDITLTNTGYFGNRILFVDAQSKALHSLEAKLTDAISPYEIQGGKKHERYHPHLTLGRLHVGFTKDSLKSMKMMAEKLLATPYQFDVQSIRVYYKPSSTERYKPFKDVLLKAG